MGGVTVEALGNGAFGDNLFDRVGFVEQNAVAGFGGRERVEKTFRSSRAVVT